MSGPRGRRFVDRVRLLVAGGDGGSGCASRFRDTRVEHGPPDGGCGGSGGDVVLVGCGDASDLKFSQKNYRAMRGAAGRTAGMQGRRGDRRVLRVPPGTVVHRLGAPSASKASQMEPASAPATLLGEVMRAGEELTVAKGGRGGRGNAAFFLSSVAQHATIAEEGGWGEVVTLQLALKTIADIGLVGFPNAGKSSLLRALSNATPRVAAYPFTTLHPHLGRVRASAYPEDELTVADIPGLVEGAHANRGLGHSFLRHIERTSLLAYVIDLSHESRLSPAAQLASLSSELDLYKPGLAAHPAMILGNKADTEGAAGRLAELRAEVASMRAAGGLTGLVPPPTTSESAGDGDGGSAVTAVSALQGKNLPRVVHRMLHGVREARRVLAACADDERHTTAEPSAERRGSVGRAKEESGSFYA